MSPISSAFLALLQTSPAKKLRGSGKVWRLDGRDREADRLRKSLLEEASRCRHLVVHYTGDSPDELSLKDSKLLKPQVWRLAPHPTADDLSNWLYMGNWQLYPRDAALEDVPDLSRSSDIEVSRFVEHSRLAFIIDSFHDDDEWTIAVNVGAQDDA